MGAASSCMYRPIGGRLTFWSALLACWWSTLDLTYSLSDSALGHMGGQLLSGFIVSSWAFNCAQSGQECTGDDYQSMVWRGMHVAGLLRASTASATGGQCPLDTDKKQNAGAGILHGARSVCYASLTKHNCYRLLLFNSAC